MSTATLPDLAAALASGGYRGGGARRSFGGAAGLSRFANGPWPERGRPPAFVARAPGEADDFSVAVAVAGDGPVCLSGGAKTQGSAGGRIKAAEEFKSAANTSRGGVAGAGSGRDREDESGSSGRGFPAGAIILKSPASCEMASSPAAVFSPEPFSVTDQAAAIKQAWIPSEPSKLILPAGVFFASGVQSRETSGRGSAGGRMTRGFCGPGFIETRSTPAR